MAAKITPEPARQIHYLAAALKAPRITEAAQAVVLVLGAPGSAEFFRAAGSAGRAVAVVIVAAVLIRPRFWPFGPCPACEGRRGRGRGSTVGAWNRCGLCGGSGEQVRPLARIYPRWRAEHRRRRGA